LTRIPKRFRQALNSRLRSARLLNTALRRHVLMSGSYPVTPSMPEDQL
jgi:hypothetical protein